MSTNQIKQFLTNPRPIWLGSVAAVFCTALIALPFFFTSGIVLRMVPTTPVNIFQTPSGLVVSRASEGAPPSASEPLQIFPIYRYSTSPGLLKGSMVFGVPTNSANSVPQLSTRRIAEVLADYTDRLGLPVGELPGTAEAHYEIAARSLRAKGARITYWSPIGVIFVTVKWLLVACLPVCIVIGHFGLREFRRCQYATKRWFAGLCPVCKYPRDDAAGDTCPECGRNMPEQATLAAKRMNRSLDDAEDWISARERKRSKRELMHDTTPTP